MFSNWFLTFGAMALPVGFGLFLAYRELNLPVIFYVLAWICGLWGLVSFFIALRLTKIEADNRKTEKKKADKDFKSHMRAMGVLKGEISGMRGDIKKWKK